MPRPFRLLSARLLTGAALAAALAGCRHTEEVVPTYDTDYFPVALRTYRTYLVADSTWKDGVVTVSQFQRRERVTAQFTDAAGLPAYQVVRSNRANTSATWVDDSVLTVQPLPRLVLQTRSNVRTVELVFPAEAGKSWNQYAFTVNGQAASYLFPDTITNLTRHYEAGAGGPFTTPVAGSQAAKTYPVALPVEDVLPVQLNDKIYRRAGRRQVFAKGVGPVLRRTYAQELFTVCCGGQQTPTGKPQNGTSRTETLVETGTF